MNQNQTFNILCPRSLDTKHLSLLGPNVLTTDKESPTFRTMVLLLLQSQALQRKFSSTLIFLTASPCVSFLDSLTLKINT